MLQDQSLNYQKKKILIIEDKKITKLFKLTINSINEFIFEISEFGIEIRNINGHK
eukprot:GAHX01000466.1.p1 GENE.GAHX01000466.1~~GAHX01000466.1.p1  ORF type:complete len:55 (+),score=9.53 GAHX01000466.1:262-426(+)